jgi:hypothetical protein
MEPRRPNKLIRRASRRNGEPVPLPIIYSFRDMPATEPQRRVSIMSQATIISAREENANTIDEKNTNVIRKVHRWYITTSKNISTFSALILIALYSGTSAMVASILYAALMTGAFVGTYIQFSSLPPFSNFYNIAGPTFPIAKASANCISVASALTVFAMCRKTITFIIQRVAFFRNIFPLCEHVHYHRVSNVMFMLSHRLLMAVCRFLE